MLLLSISTHLPVPSQRTHSSKCILASSARLTPCPEDQLPILINTPPTPKSKISLPCLWIPLLCNPVRSLHVAGSSFWEPGSTALLGTGASKQISFAAVGVAVQDRAPLASEAEKPPNAPLAALQHMQQEGLGSFSSLDIEMRNSHSRDSGKDRYY